MYTFIGYVVELYTTHSLNENHWNSSEKFEKKMLDLHIMHNYDIIYDIDDKYFFFYGFYSY